MTYQIFGESHGAAVGVVLDGVPAGIQLDMEEISRQMGRRKAKGGLSTSRIEGDLPEIVSGFYRGKTTGTPLCALIPNQNIRSEDYAAQENLPRPSHGDYAGYVRYHGANDPRGGGHFSGRLTAPLVFAGSIARQILREKGVEIGAHILQIGSVCDIPFDPTEIPAEMLKSLQEEAFPVLDESAGEAMKAEIRAAAAEGDSVGGIIQCAVSGIPCGIGQPGLDCVESVLSRHLFAVPAVKGISFGLGFDFAGKRGSEANDPMRIREGKVVCTQNNNGGVTGGITNGMPVVFQTVFKPTPSIAKPQQTVNLSAMEDAELTIHGRHDPCILSRAAVVIESAAALALMEIWEGMK
ncbi:MAG: chorismate synthase [Candidatus Merdivicinus sp.]|jgi:chorismate synthase